MTRPLPTIDDVRRFWSQHPLFAGEGRHEVGTREWFADHEAVYTTDCFAGRAPEIFTRELGPDVRLLDAGCGPGFWVRYFLRAGIRSVDACDLTTTAVELTRQSLSMFGLRAQVQVANIEHLPYADGSFGHVNCQGVVHHTPDPARALHEFHRVLQPGGTLCFSVYHRHLLLRRPWLWRALRGMIAPLVSLKGRGREAMLSTADADEIVRMYDGRENPLGRAYSIDEVRRLVLGGFTVCDVELFYFPARALPIRLPRLVHRWLSRHAGLMVVLRCRRLEEAWRD
jgi:SAM-dependent methyltransferase